MLIDALEDIEKNARAAPPPETSRFRAAGLDRRLNPASR
jgi:hypothetical protein